MPASLNIKTTKVISSIPVTRADFAKIIRHLDSNKAHGHDIITIRMLKLCGDPVLPPLELIFKSCLGSRTFSSEWKKENVVPVQKKGNKLSLKNYHPTSLLLICGKIFERLIYNKMFEYFIENYLISQNQSGFKPGDSCINQLPSIANEIYKFFDVGYETRGIFPDILKAFEGLKELRSPS